MNRDRLISNIISQIKEAQMKLGYAPETIRLYYPLESLCDLAELTVQKSSVLCEILTKDFENSILGKLEFKPGKERIEVCIPPTGALYVHEKIPTPSFLAALIALFREKHQCSMKEVKELFAAFDKDYVCKEMPKEQGFDCVMYFQDTEIDEFYYCFKNEMGHLIYHRFTKTDYQRFIG